MCGLLLIDKPAGKTSFWAVARIRRLTGERHVGHTGTLDPMATGVLPVFVGRATKLSDYLICADKSYTARIKLGTVTDTLDITGKVLSENPVFADEKQIDGVLKEFTGEIDQIPPMFSAIKKDGVRLYSLARDGKTVDLPPRRINIYSLSRQSDIDGNNEFTITADVSKGTYIRSLVRDIGDRLGCGATLSALVRKKTAGFCLDECISLDRLDADNVKDYLLPADTALKGFAAICVTAAQATRFSNGGALSLERLPRAEYADGKIIRVYLNDLFLGLGEVRLSDMSLKLKCIVNPV